MTARASGKKSANPMPQSAPRRGRPTAAQAERISHAILGAAGELFLDRGYEGTTMEAIAAAAGVPKSTLYKRHADKLKLARAAVAARLTDWSELSTRSDAGLPDDLEVRLKHYAETVVSWAASSQVAALLRLANGDWPGAREIRTLMEEAGYRRMVAFLQGEIERYAGTLPAPVADARSVAEALMALLSARMAPRTPAEQVAFAHRSVDLVLHGRARW